MSNILAVGNLKGGVGKTTVAVNLAITLANSQRDVLLVDAEGTALGFTALRAEKRASPDKPDEPGDPGYTAVSLQGADIRTQVRQLAPKYTDIIVDIGGEDATGSLRAALTVAHTFLIPVKPRTFDFWRTEETVDLIAEAREVNQNLRAIVFINEADPHGQDNGETLDKLRGLPGIEIAPVMIGRRKAFSKAEAEGLSILEYREDLKATDEMLQLVRFVTLPKKTNVHTTDIRKVANGNR